MAFRSGLRNFQNLRAKPPVNFKHMHVYRPLHNDQRMLY
jgi:hypothetical protein